MTERTVQQCWVAAVIRDDDGNVLVARWVDTQAWDLPSGVLRIGEDVCTGVRRVVSDTVAVGVTVGWLAGIHTHIRDGMTLGFPGPACHRPSCREGRRPAVPVGDSRGGVSDVVAAACGSTAGHAACPASPARDGPEHGFEPKGSRQQPVCQLVADTRPGARGTRQLDV